MPEGTFPKRCAGALLIFLLLAAPSAAAAEVFKLTGAENAERPDVAIEANGTAHVVWDEPVDRNHVLVYCQVPRGARACAATRSFPLPGVDGALGSAHVTLMPQGELVLTTTRSFDGPRMNPDTVYAIVSSDGGASFLDPG